MAATDHQVYAGGWIKAKALAHQSLEQITRHVSRQRTLGDRKTQTGKRQAVGHPHAINKTSLGTVGIAVTVNMLELVWLNQLEIAHKAVSPR